MTSSRSPRPLDRFLAALGAVAVISAACLGSPAAPASHPASPAPSPAAAASTRAPAPTSAVSSPKATATGPASPSPSAATTGPAAAATPSLRQIIGQKLVVRMDGSTPSAGLLARIRAGEIGGIILFGDDISSPDQLRALTTQLHQAAVAGGQPRLLIMTDQEGGAIRRVPWAPPAMSARAMGNDGRTSTARTQGRLTGEALNGLGIDIDLAPVADVPRTTSSFLYLQRRTFSFDPATVSRLANAFSLGLRDGGTLATMKHFPGLGRAVQNTDLYAVTIPAPLSAMQRDLTPYRAAIANRIPLIMLSNAAYAAWDPVNGAGWSRAIVRTLLRTELGFKGVTITDSITAAAKSRGTAGWQLAAKAANAGTDLLLLTGSEAATADAFDRILAKAELHQIGSLALKASYARILALKAAP